MTHTICSEKPNTKKKNVDVYIKKPQNDAKQLKSKIIRMSYLTINCMYLIKTTFRASLTTESIGHV